MFTWSALHCAVLVMLMGQSGANQPTQIPSQFNQGANSVMPAHGGEARQRVEPNPRVNQTGFVDDNPLAMPRPGAEQLPQEVGDDAGAAMGANGNAANPQPVREGAIPISPRSRQGRFFERRQRDGEDQEKVDPGSRRMAWWVTTAIGLAIVLIVIALAARAFRNMVPGMSETPSGPVSVLYRTFLTPKQSCCLIRVGDRLILVGISGDNMQTLSEITDPQEIDFIRGQCMQVRPRSTTQAFREILGGSKRMWDETLEPQEGGRNTETAGPQSEPRPGGPSSFGAAATGSPAGRRDDAAAAYPGNDREKTPGSVPFAQQMDQVRSQIEAWKARAKS